MNAKKYFKSKGLKDISNNKNINILIKCLKGDKIVWICLDHKKIDFMLQVLYLVCVEYNIQNKFIFNKVTKTIYDKSNKNNYIQFTINDEPKKFIGLQANCYVYQH